MMHEFAIKRVMSSGILKWYGSHITALFRFIGSRHVWSLGLPDLSFFNEYETVDPQSGLFNWLDNTGLKYLVYFLFEGFLRWIGTALHRVCFSVMFISTCMWYGEPGNLLIPLIFVLCW